MVIGADVYHAPPGTKRPSFAAVVSSMDRQLATYVTSVSAQLSHMEVIERMEEMISHHLRRFYELNRGVSPKRLISTATAWVWRISRCCASVRSQRSAGLATKWGASVTNPR